MTGQVELRVEWTVLPQQVDAVGAAAHVVLDDTTREPGCHCCTLATEMGEYVTLRIVEVWQSEESLRRYVRSPRFGALTAVMESAFAPPRVRVVLPTGTVGPEYIRGVRHDTETAR